MPSLKVLAFDGVVPRQSATTLADNQAQVASNVKLYSQELRTWRGPRLDYAPNLSNAKTIYKLYNSASTSAWLTWTAVVDIAPGPLSDTTEARIYYTGEAAPRKTNYSLATTGGTPYPHAYQDMGVPAPSGAPTLSLSPDGTGTAETRAYVFTMVSDFGTVREESAPSPAATITVQPVGSTVVVNAFGSAPAGTHNFTARRIYRSVAGASSDSYLFVAEIAIGTTSFSDNLTAAQLGSVLPSLGWLPPPTALTGLIGIPGTGALAGFVGNTVYFSEPFFPHAWPLAYALSVPFPIIGLAAYGTTVVVMTDRYPYYINGGTPGQMSLQRIDILEPCVAKATIATNEDGVMYASPNGLVALGAFARGVVTKALYTRDEWAKVLPSQMQGVVLNDRYIGVFPNQTALSKAIVLNRDDVPKLSNLDIPASALHIDSKNASLYYVDINDSKIYELDADNLNQLDYEWRSKRWLLPVATIFSAMRVDADYTQLPVAVGYNASVAAILAANQAAFSSNLKGAVDEVPFNTYEMNGSILTDVPALTSNRAVQITVYSAGVPVASVTPRGLDPFRLPPFKARELEFQITGNIDVRSVSLGSTVAELKQ